VELIFLGTSSGVPTLSRNVSAVAIKYRNSKAWCLVDCGEGTQHQLQRTALSLNQLATVFITHVHGDHCYGLPGLLASAGMAGRRDDLLIVAPKGVEQFVQTAIACTDMHLPYRILFRDIATVQQPLAAAGFTVEAVALSHRVPSYGYGFIEARLSKKLDVAKLKQQGIPSGPVWGQLQQGKTLTLDDGRIVDGNDFLLPARAPRSVFIAGDNDTPELVQQFSLTPDVLVHESTYTQLVADKVGPGPQHSSARQVARFAESAGIKHLVLTHFSARYSAPGDGENGIGQVEQEAQSHYSGTLFLANDFDRFWLKGLDTDASDDLQQTGTELIKVSA